MSLFRRECLYIGLESRGAGIVKLAGRRHPKVLADVYVPLSLEPLAPDLAPLASYLADPAFRTRTVRIVLADTLVRYFVTERPQGARSPAELKSLIAVRFEEQFGLPAADWIIDADLDPPARRYLACAIPRVLSDALRSMVTAAGLQLLALEPYAVSEINRWRARVPGGPAWFAAAGPEAMTVAHWSKHGWQAVRTHAGDAAINQSLEVLTERDGLLHGIAEPAPIVCTGAIGQPVGIVTRPNIQHLGATLWPGRGEAWSRTYRSALSGVWP